MASTISGLQGKTIYRNSSYAPTRGTNNPAGYLKRELSKQGLVNAPSNGNSGVFGGVSRTGNDGQSDTRSGLAANALKTTGSVGTSQSQGSALTSGSPRLTTPDTPTAQISAIGEIKLPYNFNSTANLLAEQAAAQQALLELKQQRDTNQLEYLRNVAGTQDQFDDTMMDSRNTAAGRGLSFTSAHGKDVSTQYNKFSDLMQQLSAEQGLLENQAVEQQNAIQTNLNNTIKRELASQGYEAMEKAGQWVVTKKPSPSTAKSIAKAAAKKNAAKKKSGVTVHKGLRGKGTGDAREAANLKAQMMKLAGRRYPS